jgi:hypothetical protein
MEKSNPTDREMRYWEKFITFSMATVSVGFMTLMFPAANQGMHKSVFLGVYLQLNTDKIDKNVTSLSLGEKIHSLVWESVWAFACYCLRVGTGVAGFEGKETVLNNGPIPERQG